MVIIYFYTSSDKYTAFCFGQDFLFYYSSEDMVVVGNKYDK